MDKSVLLVFALYVIAAVNCLECYQCTNCAAGKTTQLVQCGNNVTTTTTAKSANETTTAKPANETTTTNTSTPTTNRTLSSENNLYYDSEDMRAAVNYFCFEVISNCVTYHEASSFASVDDELVLNQLRLKKALQQHYLFTYDIKNSQVTMQVNGTDNVERGCGQASSIACLNVLDEIKSLKACKTDKCNAAFKKQLPLFTTIIMVSLSLAI